ncbi:MAG: TonB-dependent receptor [Chitinophagales bacterium]|nr:TonB-dependent receptor [Chitinophagales bacterium]
MRFIPIFLTVFSLFCTSILHAAGGKIFGVLQSNSDNSTLEYATLILKANQGETKYGGLTDEKGRFEIDDIKFGDYTLEISYLGFDTYTKNDISITATKNLINLGTIKMNETASQLDVVEVVGEKSMFQLGGEKKIFNVEKSAISAGGNAIDALKEIPTIDVTMDGSLSMRGSDNLVIYINGKPSGMSAESQQAILESLPANSIESIEVITNPSAKYDADGTAGIINIVLKKNYNRGLNGIVTAGYGTKYKNNAGITLNFKKKRVNFSQSLNYRMQQSHNGGYNDRKNIFGDYVNYINSEDDSHYRTVNANSNTNLDIDLTSKATLSINNVLTGGGGPNTDFNETKFYDNDNIFERSFIRTRDGNRSDFNNNASVTYFQNFSNPKQSLMVIGTLIKGFSRRPKDFVQNNYDADNNLIDLVPEQESNNNKNYNTTGLFQVDYSHPFKKHGTLEVGAKMSYRNIISDFYADSLDRATGITIPDQQMTNRFSYKELVNAAYSSFGGDYKGFTYKLGIRMEQTKIDVVNDQIEGDFNNNYVQFFPSLFVSQRLPKNHEIQFSYTYRINRPTPWMLNPFTSFDNPLELRVGNPFMNPELIHSLELTYLKNWKSTFLTASVYFRHTTDRFSRIRVVDTLTSVSTITWDNIDFSQNIGAEIIFRTPITKWWNIMLTENTYYNAVKGQITGEDNDNSVSSFQWNIRAMSSFKFWHSAELQLSYRYGSKMKYIQGSIKPMHSLDIGLKKDFLKNNKATISLNVRDIFNTMKFEIHNAGTTFDSQIMRKWETRVFTINFSYKFGRSDSQQKKKRPDQQNMMNDDQMIDF